MSRIVPTAIAARLVAIIVIAEVLFAPSASADTKAAIAKLRVLTYNIHHGEGVDGKLDLERIAAVIKTEKPDLVALQEVDQATSRTGGVDQGAKLGELTGMHSVFGKAMDYQGGGYGLAILSRVPISSARTRPLPTDPGFEPRALLEARVALANRELIFLVTHLDAGRESAQRIKQAARIPQLFPAEANGSPMILAGDLNATPDVEPVTTLLKQWRDSAAGNPLPTIPVAAPRKQIDFIFYRPAAAWRLIEVRVLEEKVASDHRPLLAVFEIVPD